jgi:hypothetical protein
MTGVDAISAITNGDWERALEWARAHNVEIPDNPQKMDKAFSYETDARDTFPTRMALIRNICEHLQSCDPDNGVVSGRLEALAEQFRRRADSAKEDGRHVEMDIWIDAETDTKRLIPDE